MFTVSLVLGLAFAARCGPGAEASSGGASSEAIEAPPTDEPLVPPPGGAAEPGLAPPPTLPEPPAVVATPFRFALGVPTRARLGLALDAVGPEVDTHIVGDERSYAVRREGASVRLLRRAPDGTVVYDVEVCADATGEPVLGVEAFAGVALVAVPTARGLVVLARTADDGAARSETVALPGPLEAPEVQLAGSSTEAIAYVRTASEAFLVRLDVERGAVLARSTVPNEIARASLDAPPGASAPFSAGHGVASVTVPGARYALRSRRGANAEIALVGADGRERWVHTLDAIPGCTSVSLVETADAVVLAAFCPSSTGAFVDVLDAATGASRGHVRPYGIGSIGHSRYSNRVVVALDGELVRVYGVESAGRYVATIDLGTAAELGCLLERR